MKNEQKAIHFQCPVCHCPHTINLGIEEIKNAKIKLKLMQKAFGHEDLGRVIVLYIDWELQIRRISSYEFVPTKDTGRKIDSTTSQFTVSTPSPLSVMKTSNKKWKTSNLSSTPLSLDVLLQSMEKSAKEGKRD